MQAQLRSELTSINNPTGLYDTVLPYLRVAAYCKAFALHHRQNFCTCADVRQSSPLMLCHKQCCSSDMVAVNFCYVSTAYRYDTRVVGVGGTL